MQRTGRGLAWLLLATLLCISLVACGGSIASVEPSPADGGPTEVDGGIEARDTSTRVDAHSEDAAPDITASDVAIETATQPDATVPTLVSIAVTPAVATIAPGATQQLVAIGAYSDGTTRDVTSAAAWASSNPSVASVSATGLVTAHLPGQGANVTAAIGTISGLATLYTTTIDPTGIRVTPTTATTSAPCGGTGGGSVSFTAIMTFSDGTTRDVTTLASWTSSDTTIATMGPNNGVAVGAGAGTATITANYASFSASATLAVTGGCLASLVIDGSSDYAYACTAYLQLFATAVFRDGLVADVTSSATWSSSDATVATVDPNGRVTAVSVLGSVNITASFQGVTTTWFINVHDGGPGPTLVVTPVTAAVGIGGARPFVVTAACDTGEVNDATDWVTWQSSAPGVASVGAGGIATGVTAGTASITATWFNATSNAVTLTVTPATLTAVVVDAPSVAHLGCDPTPLTATAVYSDGTASDVTGTATWSSSSPSIATVDASGRATPLAAGSTSVTASLGGQAGSATLTVAAGTTVSLAVTPSAAALDSGRTQQFTATRSFGDGSACVASSRVVWQSSLLNVASVDQGGPTPGLARGFSAGTTTVTATAGSITASATLSVSALRVTSLFVTPPTTAVDLGCDSAQLVATATYSDGTTVDVTADAQWSSQSRSTVIVDSQGRATGVAAGTTNVWASFQGQSASSAITVTARTTSSLAISPASSSVAAGATEQLTAVAAFTDGSQCQATSRVAWRSSAPAVARVLFGGDTPGLATGVASGSATVTAVLGAVPSPGATLTVQ
jgi:uncharacterized protein YjdB